MSRRAVVGLALAGAVVTGAAAVLELTAQGYEDLDATEQAVEAAIAALWIATGLVAWQRRPENRVGALMVALGFANAPAVT